MNTVTVFFEVALPTNLTTLIPKVSEIFTFSNFKTIVSFIFIYGC